MRARTTHLRAPAGKGSGQGGVTFVKYVDPPPPPPPVLPPPPGLPPAWPPHVELVDPGDGVWPAAWFGNLSATCCYWAVQAAPWTAEAGVQAGYDWSLPDHLEPAERGLLTLQRVFGVLPNPPTDAAALPAVAFKANAVYSMWITCRRPPRCATRGQSNANCGTPHTARHQTAGRPTPSALWPTRFEPLLHALPPMPPVPLMPRCPDSPMTLCPQCPDAPIPL